MRINVLSDLRLAKRIQARLAQRRLPALSLPLREWQELEQSAKRLDLARARGWRHAERVVQAELQQLVRQLGTRLEDLGSKLRAPPTCTPSLKDLLADLAAIREEFEDVADHCTVCHKCLTPCPVNIDFGDVSMNMRNLLRKMGQKSFRPGNAAAMFFLNATNPQTIKMMRSGMDRKSTRLNSSH